MTDLEKQPPPIHSSLHTALASLRGAAEALNRVMPGLIIVSALVLSALIAVTLLADALRMTVTVLLVLLVSIVVYFRTKDYGQASVALVAGLLTVFTVNWTVANFLIFVATWFAFTAFAAMISSVRLASEAESIYLHAALVMSGPNDDHKQIVKALREIGDPSVAGMFGPIDRADTLRLLAFRKIPIEVMKGSLKSIEMISTITKLDRVVITNFFSDFYRMIVVHSDADSLPSLDFIYETMRSSPVHPQEFIDAFNASRRIVLAKQMDPLTYFITISVALENGVPPSEMYEYVSTVFSGPRSASEE